MKLNWIAWTKWRWKAQRVTNRAYPSHGTDAVMNGNLKGSTSTDYFHFDCPRCAHGHGLDVEFLGVRDDSSSIHPRAQTIVLGLSCPQCGLRDLVKIGCLESTDYQPRRVVGYATYA